jgi:hypothetical protein
VINAVRAGHPALAGTRLIRPEDGTFPGSRRWASATQMQAALAAPAIPEVATAMSPTRDRPASSPRNGPTATSPPPTHGPAANMPPAERIGGDAAKPPTSLAPGAPEPATSEVRAWARAKGITVPDRGRLRPGIWHAWRDEQQPRPSERHKITTATRFVPLLSRPPGGAGRCHGRGWRVTLPRLRIR